MRKRAVYRAAAARRENATRTVAGLDAGRSAGVTSPQFDQQGRTLAVLPDALL